MLNMQETRCLENDVASLNGAPSVLSIPQQLTSDQESLVASQIAHDTTSVVDAPLVEARCIYQHAICADGNRGSFQDEKRLIVLSYIRKLFLQHHGHAV